MMPTDASDFENGKLQSLTTKNDDGDVLEDKLPDGRVITLHGGISPGSF
jgi:hypothetical protein